MPDIAAAYLDFVPLLFLEERRCRHAVDDGRVVRGLAGWAGHRQALRLPSKPLHIELAVRSFAVPFGYVGVRRFVVWQQFIDTMARILMFFSISIR